MIPELGHEQFREVIVRGYRIWYRVRGADAELIGILHGSRDTRG
jgi:plasmid stabilization system protein ParE